MRKVACSLNPRFGARSTLMVIDTQSVWIFWIPLAIATAIFIGVFIYFCQRLASSYQNPSWCVWYCVAPVRVRVCVGIDC